MLAPADDDPEWNWGWRAGRRRHWRDLGLKAAIVACGLLALAFALVWGAAAVVK